MNYQELLNELQTGKLSGEGFFKKRQGLIKGIEEKTKRPLIVYSAKLETAGDASNQILQEDLLGFSDLISNISGNKLDVFIESPGGDIAAAQRIVEILRSKFKNIRFFIPGSAYSAATMIALSGDEILMDQRGVLGPIDPQINGIPARSILNGFDDVQKKLKENGPKALPAYLPLIQKYDLHILEICKDVEMRAKQVVEDWLKRYMFKNENESDKKVTQITSFFSDYNIHRSHSRPIFFREAKEIGLKVSLFQEDISNDVWDMFLCFRAMHDLTNYVKLFENSSGINWGKQHMPPNSIQLQPIHPAPQ